MHIARVIKLVKVRPPIPMRLAQARAMPILMRVSRSMHHARNHFKGKVVAKAAHDRRYDRRTRESVGVALTSSPDRFGCMSLAPALGPTLTGATMLLRVPPPGSR